MYNMLLYVLKHELKVNVCSHLYPHIAVIGGIPTKYIQISCLNIINCSSQNKSLFWLIKYVNSKPDKIMRTYELNIGKLWTRTININANWLLKTIKIVLVVDLL